MRAGNICDMKIEQFRRRVEALESRYGLLVGALHFLSYPGWLRLIERARADLAGKLASDELTIVRLGSHEDSHGHLDLTATSFWPPARSAEEDDQTWFDRRATSMGIERVTRVRDVIIPIARRLEDATSRTCMFCGAPGRSSDGWSEPLDERVFGPKCEKHAASSLGKGFVWLTTPEVPEHLRAIADRVLDNGAEDWFVTPLIDLGVESEDSDKTSLELLAPGAERDVEVLLTRV